MKKIEAGELRLRNYILLNGSPYYVTGIYPDCIRLDHELDESSTTIKINDAQLQPIPLTPEILGNCGFVITDTRPDDCYGKVYSLTYNSKLGNKEFTVFNSPCGYVTGVSDNRVYYLHSLMNLFFSLTGSELDVKM